MSEVMTQSQEHQQAAPAHPPPPHRRPRVREVSSRFMSPLTTSSSTSSSSSCSSSPLRRHHESETADDHLLQRKSQQRKLFKDTPTVSTCSSSSRARSLMHHHHRSTPNLNISAATKLLLQSSGLDAASVDADRDKGNSSDAENEKPNTVVSVPSPKLRSSMPEASARFLAERSLNRLNASSAAACDTPRFSRSICFNRSPAENYFYHSLKMPEKLSKQHPTPHPPHHSLIKTPGPGPAPAPASAAAAPPPPLPPVPLANVQRKGRKSSGHQEDVHSLRLLHNHYLQWRFVNAKSLASFQSQTRETERTLYSLAIKVAELYDSVIKKRIQLGLLRRTRTLLTILEPQMPYLDQWSALESDYSVYLSEVIQALLNASHQAPVSGDVRIDIVEFGEALNSAIALMETTIFQLQSLMPKAEEMENVISKLAKVTGGERSFVEECMDLLSTTYRSQVVECSLGAQLIQLHRT